jgi:uracil-xanthine permease
MGAVQMVNRGYGMNECPPVLHLIPFSIQHALLMAFQSLPYPLLVSIGLGFDAVDTAILISCSFFVAGVSSVIQTLGIGPVGGKVPIAMVCSIVFVSPALLIAPVYGYDGYMGSCLAGTAICCGFFFLIADKIKVIFPTFISGAVVLTLGATLVGVAMDYCAGGSGSENYGDPANFVYAGVTFLIIVLLTVFGKGFLRGAAPLIGLCVGFLIAVAAGNVDFAPIEQAAWIGFPEPLHWGISFDPVAIATITLLGLCGIAELLGDTTAMTNLAANRMPTKRETRGVIFTQGITSVISAVFNGGPTISASADVGLLSVTHVFSRYVVALAGAIMALAGLCPKVAALVSVIPTSVFGGAVIMMFGVILVSGIKIIGGCHPDRRMEIILAVSLGVGLGFNAVSEALTQFPLAVSMLLCGVPGTALTGVILNLVLPGRKTEPIENESSDDSAEADTNAVLVSSKEDTENALMTSGKDSYGDLDIEIIPEEHEEMTGVYSDRTDTSHFGSS